MKKKTNINKKKYHKKTRKDLKKQKKNHLPFSIFNINVLSVNLKFNPMFDLMYMIFLPKMILLSQ